jgi:hypothetical protein
VLLEAEENDNMDCVRNLVENSECLKKKKMDEVKENIKVLIWEVEDG